MIHFDWTVVLFWYKESELVLYSVPSTLSDLSKNPSPQFVSRCWISKYLWCFFHSNWQVASFYSELYIHSFSPFEGFCPDCLITYFTCHVPIYVKYNDILCEFYDCPLEMCFNYYFSPVDCIFRRRFRGRL